MGIQAISPYYGTLQAYGDQLNTVLNNTTIFSHGGYDYWLQNVITYTDSTNTLSFENNIWNFSSPSGDFPSNSILHGLGRVESGEVYEESGPSMKIPYPFTLDLYLNTTVGSYSGSPLVNEVYFNYTVINGTTHAVQCPTTEPTGEVCGMYDNVYFNSNVAVPHGSAEIQANGYQYTPLGLPSDMEMDVGIGQSDGANANVVYANGTVGLYVLNATTHTYQTPVSTYDFGSETGETGQGALTTWNTVASQPVAYYRTGPSFVTGLWNVSGGTDGAPTITFEAAGAFPLSYASLSPGNAFIAVAQGSSPANQSFYQIAPTFGWFTGQGCDRQKHLARHRDVLDPADAERLQPGQPDERYGRRHELAAGALRHDDAPGDAHRLHAGMGVQQRGPREPFDLGQRDLAAARTFCREPRRGRSRRCSGS